MRLSKRQIKALEVAINMMSTYFANGGAEEEIELACEVLLDMKHKAEQSKIRRLRNERNKDLL